MSNRIKIFLFFALLSYFPVLAQVDTAWVRVYDGPRWDIDRATSLALDSGGNVYVAGYNNTIDYLGGYSFDYVIIKYSPKGDVFWIKNYNGTADSSDVANDIAVDKNGNVYVTGSSQGSGTEYDFVTIKYNPNGDTLWVRRYNGPANGRDDSQALAIDGSNNVYVAGSSWNGSFYDYLIIKYSNDGNTLWIRRYSGLERGDNLLVDMELSMTGNVYATGSSWNGDDYDYATIKYSEDGHLLWSRRYNSPSNANDGPADLAIDNSGNVYVTGGSATIKYLAKGDTGWVRTESGSALALDEAGNLHAIVNNCYSGKPWDYKTTRYDSDGNIQWIRYYNGPTNLDDCANAVTTDLNGNVYVTGSSHDYDSDYFYYTTIKYSPHGDTLWVRRDNGLLLSGYAAAILVDRSGNVYVTGTSVWWEPPSDIVTIKLIQCLAKPGDANGDTTVHLSDVITIIDFLFKGQSVLFPVCVGDCNGDGKVLLSDIVYLINYLFKSGPTPVKNRECCL